MTLDKRWCWPPSGLGASNGGQRPAASPAAVRPSRGKRHHPATSLGAARPSWSRDVARGGANGAGPASLVEQVTRPRRPTLDAQGNGLHRRGVAGSAVGPARREDPGRRRGRGWPDRDRQSMVIMRFLSWVPKAPAMRLAGACHTTGTSGCATKVEDRCGSRAQITRRQAQVSAPRAGSADRRAPQCHRLACGGHSVRVAAVQGGHRHRDALRRSPSWLPTCPDAG